jgi:hypothetical protein
MEAAGSSPKRSRSLLRFLLGAGVGLATTWVSLVFRRHTRRVLAEDSSDGQKDGPSRSADDLQLSDAQRAEFHEQTTSELESLPVEFEEKKQSFDIGHQPASLSSTAHENAVLEEEVYDVDGRAGEDEGKQPQVPTAGGESEQHNATQQFDGGATDLRSDSDIQLAPGAAERDFLEGPGNRSDIRDGAAESEPYEDIVPLVERTLSEVQPSALVSPDPGSEPPRLPKERARPEKQSTARIAKEPSMRGQRLAEAPVEYVTSFAHSLPSEYRRWNSWIIEHVFAPSQAGEELFVSITPTILASIAADHGGCSMSPEAAESAFLSAVREAYRIIISSSAKLRILRTFDSDGLPLAPAFLAVSVLAAYRMHSDEDVSGRAYYVRLAELLGCDMSSGVPVGFDQATFESLWVFTARWIADKTGAKLALPGEDVGNRRFVALPLTHVPLRRLDIERLPSFFAWAAYPPGAKLPVFKLGADLDRWVRSYAGLSSAGGAALRDDRRAAVLAQVALELEAWDGSVMETSGRRTAPVEVLLDIVGFRPNLFYLPRRPEGFPPEFDDGTHFLESGEDGWYTALQLSAADGGKLSTGFEWQSANLSLRRKGSVVVPLGPSPDYTGFLSRATLVRGAPCAVLCEAAVAPAAAAYLSASTGQDCTPWPQGNLPNGWRLFSNLHLRRRVDVPDGLDPLAVASDVEILFSGGLRIGRSKEWLAGAPPQIIVSGLDESEVVTVDGQAVGVDQDGVLQTNGHLFTPGSHIVAAGSVRRMIDIVEPQLPAIPQRRVFTSKRRTVALPPGYWYLIGAVAGQVTSRISVARPGGIGSAEFDPVWAVSVNAGPGSTLISIDEKPSTPQRLVETRKVSHPRVQQWISIIYGSAIRRPKLFSLAPNSDHAVIYGVWRRYVETARAMKRAQRRK